MSAGRLERSSGQGHLQAPLADQDLDTMHLANLLHPKTGLQVYNLHD